jgi:hypothetical protein
MKIFLSWRKRSSSWCLVKLSILDVGLNKCSRTPCCKFNFSHSDIIKSVIIFCLVSGLDSSVSIITIFLTLKNAFKHRLPVILVQQLEEISSLARMNLCSLYYMVGVWAYNIIVFRRTAYSSCTVIWSVLVFGRFIEAFWIHIRFRMMEFLIGN